MNSLFLIFLVLALVATDSPAVFAGRTLLKRGVPAQGVWQGNMLCTGHNFVGLAEELGTHVLDQTLSCGARYRELNLGFVTAMQGMGGSMCNQCLQIQSAATGKSTYVLALDVKGSAGFDIAEGAWKALGHNAKSTSNRLHPSNAQSCNWRVVDPIYCHGYCVSKHADVVCKRGCQAVIDSKTFETANPSVQKQVRGLCSGSVLPGSTPGWCSYKGQSVNCKYISSVNDGSPFTAAGPNWYTSSGSTAAASVSKPPTSSSKPPSTPQKTPTSAPKSPPSSKPPSSPPSSSSSCVGSIKNGSSCKSGVSKSTCSGVYYATCVNNKWLLRSCAAGTACKTSGSSFYCAPKSHKCPNL